MKSTSDLFNEIIPLGRLIHMVNQKKDRLLNEYLSPLDITAAQFKVLCSIRCAACITPVELKKVLSVDLGALTRMLDRLVCKGWVERLPNPNDKRGVLVKLTTGGAAICEQCHQFNRWLNWLVRVAASVFSTFNFALSACASLAPARTKR